MRSQRVGAALFPIDDARHGRDLEPGVRHPIQGGEDGAPRGHHVFHHEDGSEDVVLTSHTLNEDQIDWFRAGSALNLLRQGE